jgi:hypothetical protein
MPRDHEQPTATPARALPVKEAEYHRRRAEAEMERALQARKPCDAILHLELARIHREKRDRVAMAWRNRNPVARTAIGRTDKES